MFMRIWGLFLQVAACIALFYSRLDVATYFIALAAVSYAHEAAFK